LQQIEPGKRRNYRLAAVRQVQAGVEGRIEHRLTRRHAEAPIDLDKLTRT